MDYFDPDYFDPTYFDCPDAVVVSTGGGPGKRARRRLPQPVVIPPIQRVDEADQYFSLFL